MKKLLAVLMAMAMVLGMGVVASADATTEATAVLKINDIEQVEANGTVDVTIVATQDVMMNAYTFSVEYDETKFEFANVWDAENEEYTGLWGLADYSGTTVINTEEAGKVTFAGAGTATGLKKGGARAGATVATVTLKALADVAVDDVVATLTVAGITDDAAGNQYMKNMEVVARAIAKATTAPTTAPTVAPTTAPTTAATTAATTVATKATTAATTAKKATTEAEALALIKDLATAKAVAAKLTKADFANAADFEALQAAVKAGDLAKITAAIAKANDAAVIAAVNAVVAAATTTTAKVKADKTGDASNALALMIVAMVAFGTAVVVYRKKVNA